MIERVPKLAVAGAAILGLVLFTFLAYTSPGYFTSKTYLMGILFLEVLLVAVYFYRKIFFPLILVAFLFAGLNVAVGTGWTTARWIFLGVGAAVGLLMVLKERSVHLRLFHLLAFFTVLAAITSAAVSPYPRVALLKSLSLFLLFLYAGTGMRIAVLGRENQFFEGLLLGCELFVAGIAAFRLVGIQAMGNPNSLGAVMGVVAAPILLWGVLIEKEPGMRRLRIALYLVCVYLLCASNSRASIAAGMLSFGLLTLALRRYKLLIQGLAALLVVVAILAIVRPEDLLNRVSSFEANVMFKGGDYERGLLASRESPWQSAMGSIRNHLWFGTGFGTTDNGQDASQHLGSVASTTDSSAEHGSSYLAITTWVGLVGVIPFFFLILVLLEKVTRSLLWLLRSGNPMHPAVPLALVVVAGLFHAGFEDWLFAPGYYLCVFFWSIAFSLVDVAPSATLPGFTLARRYLPVPQIFRGVSASR